MVPAAALGSEDMADLAEQTNGARIVSMLPYRLRALKRRQKAARMAQLALLAPSSGPSSDPAARLFCPETGPMRAGIRHIASGRMTVIHAEVKTALAMLATRSARRRGLLQDEGLEAVVVDGQRQVFAGFWA